MKKTELQAAFNAVFSNSYQAILRLDADYSIVDYNPAAADWIGKVYDKKVGAGDSFLEYLPGEDVEEFKDNIKRTIGEEQPHYKLFSIIGGKDQTEYWTEYQFYPVIIASVFTGLYVFIFDITERKNVIDEVARSTRRFYSLIKNSSDIVSVIDADGFIRFMSNSVEKILGYLPGDITGKNFMEYIFPVDLENFKTAFSGSMSADRKSFVSQFRFLHREGYWVFLESLGSNHLGDETVRGVILNSRDVTDRRHFEEMLKKISRQNELILDSAGEGIYGMNRDGRITFANPAAAEMMGFRVEEIIGRNHTEIVKQVTAEGVSCPVGECRYYTSMLDGNTCSVDDAFFTRSDGSVYPVEYISTAIKEKGEIVGAVVTFNDISERKRNEEELLKAKEEADAANRAKSEFLANMSHEIRTPIHNILGFLEMLDSTQLDRTQREYVSISRESTRTLLEIISDILDYSKIEKGKIEIEVSDFNPRVLFESTVELFSATAAERNLNLYAFIDPGLPDLLVGDSLRIRQVLNNLIGNAMKFTPRQGEVAIDIVMEERTAEGCRVSFSVLDTGIGVPEEKQHYIFRSFTQADSSVARKYGGTGLGLSISSNLVKLMGGELRLESTQGVGSRFFFELLLPFPENIGAERPRWNIREGLIFYLLREDGADDRYGGILHRYIRGLGREIIPIENISLVDESRGTPMVFAVISRENQSGIFNIIENNPRVNFILIFHDHRIEVNGPGAGSRCVTSPVTASKIIEAVQEILIGALRREEPAAKKDAGVQFEGNVLVAEDTPASQKLMKLMLERLGFSVDLAADGKETLEMYRINSYRLVFMDINMPVYDGVEAARRILAYEKKEGLGHVPIIALTAKAVKGDRERFLREGMDEYLSKPVTMEALLKVVSAFIEKDKSPGAGPPGKKSPENERDTTAAAAVLGIDEGAYLGLVRDFLDDSAAYLGILEKAVVDKDMKQIELASHRIKGAASNYNFTNLADAASSMENAAAGNEMEFDYAAVYGRVVKEFELLEKRFH